MGVKRKKEWLGMEKVKECLRLWEQGASKVGISRSLNVHRNTVADYISRARVAGIDYQQSCELSESELKRLFAKRSSGRRTKGSRVNFEQVHKELSKAGVTLLLLWEEYLREDPTGYSYSQFCFRYREWKSKSKLSMRQVHKAGERLFVDYSGAKVPIVDLATGEVICLAEIFVATLGASNYTYVEATQSQSLPHWLGSHVRAFEYFGGVPEIIVPDNLKSGVTSPCRYEPELNPSYRDLAEHYGVAVIPARVRKPKDKAKVETSVQVIQRRILAKLRNSTFASVEELNEALKPLLKELNERPMQGYKASRKQLFEELDKPALKSLPPKPYRFAAWKKAKVNIDYHVEIKKHYYSVPYQLIGKTVAVRFSELTVEIFFENNRVALHKRSSVLNRHSTIKEHMPPSHQYMQDWTPSRLLEWAEKIGRETKVQVHSILLSRKHPEQAYRSCLGLLSLAKKYGNSRLELACKKANELNVVSMRSIKSMLQTGNDKISSKNSATSTQPLHHTNIRGDTEFH